MQEVPCWQAHPGLCGTMDSSYWTENMDSAGAAFLQVVLDGQLNVGDFFEVSCEFQDASLQRSYWYACYVRYAGPPLAVFCQCDLFPDNRIRLRHAGNQFMFRESLAVVACLFANGDVTSGHARPLRR